MERQDHDLAIGHVISNKKEIRVAVKGGFTKLLEVQISGKRKMKTQEILNGLKLSKSAHMV